ncbi:hypothetical protein [Nocardioides sp.]|uniref:hypothetical protein n=1 Tax=Nocardioides sp. TaxID=35761 RepID=UPI003D104885
MEDQDEGSRHGTGAPAQQNGSRPHVPMPRAGDDPDRSSDQATKKSGELPTTSWFDELQTGFAELESEIAELESGVADLESGFARIAPAAVRPSRMPEPEPEWTLPAFDPFPDAPVRRPAERSEAGLPGGFLRWLLVLLVVLALILGGWAMLRARDDAPAQPAETPKAATPQAPVTLPTNGSFVQSTVLADGDIMVQHWIRTPGVSKLTLSVPDVGANSALKATKVVIVADDRRLFGRSTIDAASRTHYIDGATSIYVSYLLEGAVERNGTTPGRALARVTSLDVEYDATGGVSTHRIEGADVLTLACYPTSSAGADVRPCGDADDGPWEVSLSGPQRNDRVMAQFDQQ